MINVVIERKYRDPLS